MHSDPAPAFGSRTFHVLFAGALAALSTTGCATPDAVRYGEVVAVPAAYDPAQRPLSLGEIIAALRSGRSQHELADEIDARGLLAPATDADIDLLLQMGANSELIDAVRDASQAPRAAGVPYGPASPPVIVTPPATVYPDYGWYPYAPYAPYSFGFYYYDVPHRHLRRRPDDRFDRDRGDRFRSQRNAPPPTWQSPRGSPGVRNRVSPDTDQIPGIRGSARAPRDGRPDRTPSQASPRSSQGAPGAGAIRPRSITD